VCGANLVAEHGTDASCPPRFATHRLARPAFLTLSSGVEVTRNLVRALGLGVFLDDIAVSNGEGTTSFEEDGNFPEASIVTSAPTDAALPHALHGFWP
jgi:hypothetical protein